MTLLLGERGILESPILHFNPSFKPMKTRGKLRREAPETRQAVGASEAAAIMGVHFATPAKMLGKGLLTAHVLDQVYSIGNARRQVIFDGLECEKDYLDYEARMADPDDPVGRRPRAYLDLRPAVLKHLRAVQTPISFADAIGVAEAAKILSVHPSFVSRLVSSGEIVGRVAWGQRRASDVGRQFILSRRSCLENVAKARALQAGGGKVGRPRKLS
jgi:hypothetical protein